MSSQRALEEKPTCVIYINGWPGVGKLTVAKALQHKISGSQILHNHELIDPVEELYPRTSSEYVHQRTIYRRARLAEIAKSRSTAYIFTDAQTDYNTCVDDYVQLAQTLTDRRFYSIVLQCELEENIRRLTSVERSEHSKGKLTDVEILRGLRDTMEIHRFYNDDELVVDVTSRATEETVARIVEFVNL